MIRLSVKAEFSRPSQPFVTKLRCSRADDSEAQQEHEAIVRSRAGEPGVYDCAAQASDFVLRLPPEEPLDGDVVLCVPARNGVDRLFRRSSRHNTLLMTERCDQLCLMCSQPPKNTNDEWRFPYYEQALLLADMDTVVGISGGEPTLYKEALFGMIGRVAASRPDLSYHILSNGQHFTDEDRSALAALHRAADIVWGVPLYSHVPATHDEIVGKPEAFAKLLENLFFLASTGARIELRTVITARNIFDLPNLARFVATHIPFVGDWAIMAMEPIGYALPNCFSTIRSFRSLSSIRWK
jgi:His-Xaa-Ser system radical SAM maturase HxsC